MELVSWQIAELQSLISCVDLEIGGEWKTIELEPQHYYSCCENLNIVVHHSYKDTRGVNRKARLMTLRPDFDGYLMCSFKNKAIRFHRLKAMIFLPEYTEDLEVNHKDGNKQNNAVCNLEMVSHHENILHFYNDPQVKALKDARIQHQKDFITTPLGKEQQAKRAMRMKSDEVRQKHSNAMKSYYSSQVNREKTSKALKDVCKSDTRRKQMSDAMKRKWQDPIFRRNMLESRSNLPKEVQA